MRIIAIWLLIRILFSMYWQNILIAIYSVDSKNDNNSNSSNSSDEIDIEEYSVHMSWVLFFGKGMSSSFTDQSTGPRISRSSKHMRLQDQAGWGRLGPLSVEPQRCTAPAVNPLTTLASAGHNVWTAYICLTLVAGVLAWCSPKLFVSLSEQW